MPDFVLKRLVPLFIFLCGAGGAAATCKNPEPVPADLNLEALKRYSVNGRFTTPEDFICCLSRDRKIELVVVHSSISAQRSDPKNPRVLAVIKDDDGRVQGVFSVNSGAAHLSQRNSVEMMIDDRVKGELAFMDFDFEGHRRRASAPNPETCMNCHGEDGKSPVGGPRPVFDRFPWPRVAAPAENEPPYCPERAKLEPGLRRQALTALRKNPRYACLADKPEMNLFDFDAELARLNERRLVKVIRASKDYESFKYAIAAAMACHPFAPEDVLPDRVLRGMTHLRNVDARVARTENKRALQTFLKTQDEARLAAAKALDAKHRRSIAQIRGDAPLKLADDSDGENQCRLNPSFNRTDEASLERQFPGANPIYHKYLADSLRQDSEMGPLRFLFEARGFQISDWNMKATAGYGRKPTLNLLSELLALEPDDSDLKKIFRRHALLRPLSQNGRPVSPTLTGDGKSEKEGCEELKNRSFQAFNESRPKIKPAVSDGTTR